MKLLKKRPSFVYNQMHFFYSSIQQPKLVKLLKWTISLLKISIIYSQRFRICTRITSLCWLDDTWSVYPLCKIMEKVNYHKVQNMVSTSPPYKLESLHHHPWWKYWAHHIIACNCKKVKCSQFTQITSSSLDNHSLTLSNHSHCPPQHLKWNMEATCI